MVKGPLKLNILKKKQLFFHYICSYSITMRVPNSNISLTDCIETDSFV